MSSEQSLYCDKPRKQKWLTALIMAAQRPNNQEIIDLIQNAIDK